MQKVLICTTRRPELDDFIIKWKFNDAKNSKEDYINYPTIMHALGDNWKLLAPPREYIENWDRQERFCDWWLVKE